LSINAFGPAPQLENFKVVVAELAKKVNVFIAQEDVRENCAAEVMLLGLAKTHTAVDVAALLG